MESSRRQMWVSSALWTFVADCDQDSWYRQTGHPRDPSLTDDFSWVDCIHDDDKDFVMSKWVSLARGHQLTFEMRWKTKSPHGGGSPSSNATWVLAVCGPTFDDNGTMEGISGCLTDITAQKKSQRDSVEKLVALERARASEARFARFIEVAPVAIYIVGTNGEVTNLTITAVLRSKADELHCVACLLQ